jgi:hypothetical protein
MLHHLRNEMTAELAQAMTTPEAQSALTQAIANRINSPNPRAQRERVLGPSPGDEPETLRR